MQRRPADVDIRQSVKDMFFPPNGYHIVDDFILRDGKRHPVAFLLPGGGYFMVSSFIEGVPVAKKLNEQGVSAIIVYYRTKKKALYPAPLEDLARAIREVFARADEYRIETDNYSVWGASAGGHLAAAFGTKNMGYPVYNLPKPGALVLAYPVISMTRSLTHRQSHDFFVGKDARAEQEAFASVEQHVDADYPATFLWCSDDDATVDPDNTRKMKQALDEAGVVSDCTIFHGVMHGAGPATGTPAEGWIDRAVHFWLKKGKQDKKQLLPYFTQGGEDREENGDQYLANLRNGSWAGFKYFAFDGMERQITVSVRGTAAGTVKVYTNRNMSPVASILIRPSKDWTEYTGKLSMPAGAATLYFVYEGAGALDFRNFTVE